MRFLWRCVVPESMTSVPRPTGPAAAALVASGIGCAGLGILTVLAEASPRASQLLNLYDPVGPLGGKALGAVLVYALSWVIFAALLRGKSPRLGSWVALTFALVGLGLLLTFPPIYKLFAAH